MLKPHKLINSSTPLTNKEAKILKQFPYIEVRQVAGSDCTVTIVGETLILQIKYSDSLEECIAFARDLSKLTEMPAFGSRTTFTTIATQETFNVN